MSFYNSLSNSWHLTYFMTAHDCFDIIIHNLLNSLPLNKYQLLSLPHMEGGNGRKIKYLGNDRCSGSTTQSELI